MRTFKPNLFTLSIVLLSLASSVHAHALERDSVATAADTVIAKPNILQRVINYFKESNAPVRHKGMDFSILGGPHYSSDTKLGIGIVAAGQYYTTPPADTITHISNLSLVGDITTGGFYKIGVRGNHFTPENHWRLDYYVDFYSFLRQFWGIGYEAGAHSDSYEKFRELRIKANFDALWRMGGSFYIGPTASFTHLKANKVTEQWRWDGQRLSTFTTSAGIKLTYDTRDNLTATQRGWMVMIHQGFSPRFLGNRYSYIFTELTSSGFWKGWKDAVICLHLHSLCNFGDVPWGMMATFGGSDIMRGYYEGRFRDKCEIDATVEIRQHVWRRNGVVAWVGAGSVAPRPSAFRWRKILPNGGIGYRWEFKKRTNVRLDFGVGRNETSFIFNINEAF